MSGFQPRGNFARCGERLFFMFGLKPGADTGFQKGIPPSADGGQPARLDRAGPQARTRFRLRAGWVRPRMSHAGGSLPSAENPLIGGYK